MKEEMSTKRLFNWIIVCLALVTFSALANIYAHERLENETEEVRRRCQQESVWLWSLHKETYDHEALARSGPSGTGDEGVQGDREGTPSNEPGDR
jgi:hypothetical protein